MTFLKNITPPLFYRWLNYSPLKRHGWFGDYPSWKEAEASSKGYDNAVILEKVKTSLLKVKNGQAAFERDSVLFDTPQYDWPIIAALTWIAAQHNGRLNILDFGGSLGSTYYQNKKFLDPLDDVRWNVVEQSHFVTAGKQDFEDDRLRFYFSIEECIAENKINVALLSSVLPYLQKPYDQLQIFDQFPFVIIDKMPLISSSRDRITIQKVSPKIYPASYPSWFFSEQAFRDFTASRWRTVAEFEREINANFPAKFKGFVFMKKY